MFAQGWGWRINEVEVFFFLEITEFSKYAHKQTGNARIVQKVMPICYIRDQYCSEKCELLGK